MLFDSLLVYKSTIFDTELKKTGGDHTASFLYYDHYTDLPDFI